MAKLILIAATTLVGGIMAKGDEFKPFEVAAGDELTDELIGKLGLDKKEVARLQDNGAIVEVSVRAAGDDSTADLAADLAAAINRAEEAEAKAKDLETKIADMEKQLEEATKPPPAAGKGAVQ